MAAPVEIDLAMPVDLGLGNAAAATKAGGRGMLFPLQSAGQ